MNEYKLGSMKDFDEVFATEEKCKSFFARVRWGDTPQCPYCDYKDKIYRIERGGRYKCGNQKCYKKFSVITKTYIHSSNLPIKLWLTCFYLYIKSKGRFSATSLPEINWTSAYFIDNKIKEIFYNIHKDFGDTEFLFQEAVRQTCILTDKLSRYHKSIFLNTHILSPLEIIDWSNGEQYRRIEYFTLVDMYYAINRRWHFHKFCEPKEIIAECIIYLSDCTEVVEMKAEDLIKLLRKTRGKMWAKYVKDHPNIENWVRNYSKEYRRKGRINLKNWYVSGLARMEKDWASTTELEKIIKEKREKLIDRRRRCMGAYDIDFSYVKEEKYDATNNGRVKNINPL